MISTKDSKPEDKKAKLKQLKAFHQATLDALGVTGAVFFPKMAYRPYGKTEKFISFFLSEISKGEDIFVEFCSKENNPEDPDRTLYKWKFNTHYEAEYEVTEPNPDTGHVRYLVPVGELIVIKSYPVITPGTEPELASQAEMTFDDIPNPDTDLPMDQMTIRDYAAIHMRKPVSTKQWLNLLIKE